MIFPAPGDIVSDIIVDQNAKQSHNKFMSDNRRNPRYPTMSYARIPKILEGETLLKDISVTGCCVESSIAPNIQIGAQYQLDIEPEGESYIGNFRLLVESRWIRNGGSSTEAGFFIIASPKGRQFQNYVDYLAYRNS